MFRKSEKNRQANLFFQVENLLPERSSHIYSNDEHWHNQFRSRIVNQIDEGIFSCLFSKGKGAPNSSIRLLIGMVLVKEAFGWSDAELFQQVQFNLLVRSALGLHDLTDAIPAESTYYLLRKRMFEHLQNTGEDLMTRVFEQVTSSQIMEFQINGQEVRMDSKLIGSNVASYSRYELIHRTFHAFLKAVDKHGVLQNTSATLKQQLTTVLEEDSGKTAYHSTKEQLGQKLLALGLLVYQSLGEIRIDIPQREILQQVFDHHFEWDGTQVVLRQLGKGRKVGIQSPDDPECGFTNKAGKSLTGYSVNLTETTTTKGELNLITSLLVGPANTADSDFTAAAIKQSEQVCSQKVTKGFMDGAFHSHERERGLEDVDLVFTGLSGVEPRYILEVDGQDLIATDSLTGVRHHAIRCKQYKQGRARWSFKDEGKTKSFDEDAVRAAQLRSKLKSRTREELQRRNNVEASIYHLTHRLKGGKVRYRGLFATRVWALCRGVWVNLMRIIKFVTALVVKPTPNGKKSVGSDQVGVIESALWTLFASKLRDWMMNQWPWRGAMFLWIKI